LLAPPAQADEQSVLRLQSWLADPEPTMLAGLVTWLGRVLVHYPDTADALGECWPLHPWIVEELLALQAAWYEAYDSGRPSGTKAVDWHARHKPGVLHRIRRTLADCTIDAHRPGGRADHTRLSRLAGVEHAERAADWWSACR